MSVEHDARLRGVVKNALKDAAMGEPFGSFVTFTFAPQFAQGPDGSAVPVGLAPAWFILVTIRATGLGEPDIGNGRSVYGVLPSDAEIAEAAVSLLGECRKERDDTTAKTLQVGRDLTNIFGEAKR